MLLMFAIPGIGQSINRPDIVLIKTEITGIGNAKDCGYMNDYNSYFLRISILNNADTAISFWIMKCSWMESWLIDNSNLRFCLWGCDSNFPVNIKLEPQKSIIFYGIVHPIDNKVKIDKFRLGFVMLDRDDFSKCFNNSNREFIKNKITYWSDYVQLFNFNNRYIME
jgi:hypothetical protein